MAGKQGTQTRWIQGYEFEITKGKHSLMSDVTEKAGGTDLGMDPHDLLESALAGCTAMTVMMYARRKSWPLEDINVMVSIVSESKEATVIKREIQLRGSLDSEQRQRLMEIADKCPIHKILKSEISIESLERPVEKTAEN